MRILHLLLLIAALLTGSVSFGQSAPFFPDKIQEDTTNDNQTLYNGKIWRNKYYLVMEHQFLFSREYLPGSISVKGHHFDNVLFKYDIFNDELITPLSGVGALQINKEMIDSFDISFSGRAYHFIKFPEDSSKGNFSYYNVIYNGSTPLLLKYSKKIDKLVVEGKYDQFYQIVKIYVLKNMSLHQVTGKKDLLDLFSDRKVQLKAYIKANKLKISGKLPESFIPAISYYDQLNH